MAKPDALTIQLRVVYDGTQPNVWHGGAKDFGLQDKADLLFPGTTQRDGSVVFEVALTAKPGNASEPVFLGDFAHGPPKDRFLYLSWRNPAGGDAQRLKLPLRGITWSVIEAAKDRPLVGEVAPNKKPRVPGGTNIGGTRAVVWRVA